MRASGINASSPHSPPRAAAVNSGATARARLERAPPKGPAPPGILASNPRSWG